MRVFLFARVTGWLCVACHRRARRMLAGRDAHAQIVEEHAPLSAAIIAGVETSRTPMGGYVIGCDQLRLRSQARPGDTLDMTVELMQYRRGICRTRAVAQVSSTILVRAVLTTIVRPALAALA